MNGKNKIIVSIVGITIVLLALLGITYGYYLTRIEGNTNTNSISLTTADLKLVYGDDNGFSIGEGEKIKPGKIFETKTFSVENTGNERVESYAIVLENLSIIDKETGKASDLKSSLIGKENDFILKITCSNGSINCNGYEGEFPEENKILITNSIDINEKQVYSINLEYKETGKKQSGDMNKTISARFNIIDLTNPIILEGKLENKSDESYYVKIDEISQISHIDVNNNFRIFGIEHGTFNIKVCKKSDNSCSNPVITREIEIKMGNNKIVNNEKGIITLDDDYMIINISINTDSREITLNNEITKFNPYANGLLKDNIIYNSKENINGTNFVEKTQTKIGEEISAETESVLSITEDDYGKSYYYRGNVKDNFLNFANMCWRIVRIEGDGSTKLILEDETGPCIENTACDWMVYTDYYSWLGKNVDNEEGEEFVMGDIVLTKFKEFQNRFNEKELSKLKIGEWCYNIEAYERSNSIPYTYTLLTNKYLKNMYYDTYTRLSGENKNGYLPTLKCAGNTLNNWNDENNTPMYSNAITADEVVYAGGSFEKSNSNYYLTNKYNSTFWTLSPSTYKDHNDKSFVIYSGDGKLSESNVNYSYGYRPSIILKKETLIKSGDGTRKNPYVIK